MVDNELVKKEFEKYNLWIRKREELTIIFNELADELYSIQGINYVANSIKKIRDQKKVELYRLDLIQRKDKIEKKIEEVNGRIDYLWKLTNLTSGADRLFIIEHYMKGRSHTEIAEEYKYSRRSVGYVINRGFKEIAEKLEKRK